MEEGGADFSAREMLAVVKVVVLAALVVVEANQLPLESVLIVGLVVEHIGAQHDLVVFGYEGALDILVAHRSCYIHCGLQVKIVHQQAVRNFFEEVLWSQNYE